MPSIINKIDNEHICSITLHANKDYVYICACSGSYEYVTLDKGHMEQLIKELTALKDQMI